MTTGAIAVAMVVVVAVAIVLPLLSSRRVLVFLVQMETTFVFPSATASASFTAHDSMVLSVPGSACRPVVVVHIVIAD